MVGNETLKAEGWLMIHESGVYSHPEINGGWPFTEQEALTKAQPPTNDAEGEV